MILRSAYPYWGVHGGSTERLAIEQPLNSSQSPAPPQLSDHHLISTVAHHSPLTTIDIDLPCQSFRKDKRNEVPAQLHNRRARWIAICTGAPHGGR